MLKRLSTSPMRILFSHDAATLLDLIQQHEKQGLRLKPGSLRSAILPGGRSFFLATMLRSTWVPYEFGARRRVWEPMKTANAEFRTTKAA